MSRTALELNHRVSGPQDGPPLVFINSLGTDMGMWDAQIAAFADGFRVVAYDARGQGRSPVPPPPYSVEELAHDALDLLDRLGIERASLCGVSLGGHTALRIAATHPERVDRVILANTAARIATPEFWDDRVARVRSGGMEAIKDTVIARFFTGQFRSSRPDVVARFEDMLMSAHPDGYIGACLALRDSDLHDLTGDVAAPALIVVGVEDLATPPSDSEWLHEHIAGGELFVLDDAAHLSNVEQPERFNAAATEFLSPASA